MNKEPTPLEEAKIATRNNSAGHWPYVAEVLLEEVERLEKQVASARRIKELEDAVYKMRSLAEYGEGDHQAAPDCCADITKIAYDV